MSSEWKQLNKSVWQRVYANGTVGLIRGEGDFLANEIAPDGRLQLCHQGISGERCYDAAELMKKLDAKHDPKPDVIDRTETSTYYRKGERAAMVEKLFSVSTWFVSEASAGSHHHATRERAEAAALSYVLGQS